ncbi:MAG: hypothetical protein ABL888_10955 [Pirellulaceae bacterium]
MLNAVDRLNNSLNTLSCANQEVNVALAQMLDRAFYEHQERGRSDYKQIQKTIDQFLMAELTLDPLCAGQLMPRNTPADDFML